MVPGVYFDEPVVVLVGNQNVSGRVEVVSLSMGRKRAGGD
jgi:hypothetical protein